MSDNKKLKGNWRLVSVVVFLVSIIFACIPVEQALPVEEAPPVEQALPVEQAPPVEEDGQEERQRTSNNNSKHFGASLKKPLWDWLELGSKLIVPPLIFIFGVWFQKRDKEKAKDNLAEEAMQAYLKSMADILLDEQRTRKLFPAKNQSESSDDNDNPVRDLARALTIEILRRLGGDSKRQARIISFLRDTELFKFIFEKASMNEINFSKAELWGANLKEAKLKKANFQGVDLYAAELQKAELHNVDFREANLKRVNLLEAKLGGANLKRAYIVEANLKGAYLVGAEGLTNTQIKLACLWEEAIYKAELNEAKETFVVTEPDNTNYIEDLKKDKSSDPKEPPDCSRWNH